MNELRNSKSDDQLEELLLLTEQMQEELDQKDQTIRKLKMQLDESLTLNERLNLALIHIYHAGASGRGRTKQDLCADTGKGGRCPCLPPISRQCKSPRRPAETALRAKAYS